MTANTRPRGRRPKAETVYNLGTPSVMDTPHGNLVFEFSVANPCSETHPTRDIRVVMSPDQAAQIKRCLDAESWQNVEARGGNHMSAGRVCVSGVDDTSEVL